MHHKFGFTVLALCSLVILSGCVDRAAADAKLLKGCQAGVNAFLPDGEKIESLNNKTIRDNSVLGGNHREVILEAVVSDGFHAHDEKYTCIFLEEFGAFNTTHRASIYSLDMGGRIIGYENGQILGGLEDIDKLGSAIDKAMR